MVGNWAKCLGQSLRTWVIQVEKKGGSQSQSNLDIVSWKCLRLLETIKSELTADVVEIRDKHESFHFKKFQPTTSPDRILRRLVCHMGNSLTNWSLRSHTLSHLWNSKSTFLCFNSLHQIWIALFPSGASLLANAQKFPASHGITSSADLGFFKSKEFKFSPWDVFDCGRKTHFILEDQGLPESPWPFARVEDPLFSLFRIGDDLLQNSFWFVDSFSWSKFKKNEGHRELNKFKGTLVISCHQTSSKRETITVSIWSAQARTLGFGSSSTLTSKRQPPDFRGHPSCWFFRVLRESHPKGQWQIASEILGSSAYKLSSD